MKIKTSNLTNRALDYAVALAEGATQEWRGDGPFFWHGLPAHRVAAHDIAYRPSTGPAGDDIIDREGISAIRCDEDFGSPAPWAAGLKKYGLHLTEDRYPVQVATYQLDEVGLAYGTTRREAAMRCWVAFKLGDEVEIPDELT